MTPFKIIRKSTSTQGNLAKTYLYCYPDRIVIYQLFLLKKRQKGYVLLCKKFGMYLYVNSMAFKNDTFLDITNNLIKELLRQNIIEIK